MIFSLMMMKHRSQVRHPSRASYALSHRSLDLTTHEARTLALREQIAELEAENVAEKDWVLKGEVTSRSRPTNALLEEDLDFETAQKAVPVVTDEVVKDLEELEIV